MEYCLLLWDGAGQTVLGSLNRLQNCAIILISDRSVPDDIPPLQVQSLSVPYQYGLWLLLVGAMVNLHL